nr:MAG TPA: hypothetical protein [Caudoviricetes sp.]
MRPSHSTPSGVVPPDRILQERNPQQGRWHRRTPPKEREHHLCTQRSCSGWHFADDRC